MHKVILTDKGWSVEIHYYKRLESTQLYLKEALKAGEVQTPVMVVADVQTGGIGSRGNQWQSEHGNLFFSFALHQTQLPADLPQSSIAIYVSFLLKMVLEDLGSKTWIKWPNDFYLEDSKIGGTITHKVEDNFICGIGLNLNKCVGNFSELDIDVGREELLDEYQKMLEKKPSWKMVLKKFEVEFELSRRFHTHKQNEKISLENAKLCEDGSILIDTQRIYSLR